MQRDLSKYSSIKRNPDFIGIGVQRAGTSWLYVCLKEHPQIYMPRKEIHFFDDQFHKGDDWYSDQFSGGSVGQKTGEFTPDYIASETSINRIASYNPNVKLILVLREPLSRAYSAFRLYQAHGKYENFTFCEALQRDKSLFEQSLYYKQIEDLLNIFKRSNLHIEIYEDIIQEPDMVFRRVCKFLDVDESYSPVSLYLVKNSSAHSGLQRKLGLVSLQNRLVALGLSKYLNLIKKTIVFKVFKAWLVSIDKKTDQGLDLDQKIIERLREETKCLEGFLGLNLSVWLEKYDEIENPIK